jgi:hypothetical protein
MTSSGMEPVTFRLVAWCLNHIYIKINFNVLLALVIKLDKEFVMTFRKEFKNLE